MNYPTQCPKCNTRFPEEFWKMADTASQNKLFYCPACKVALNSLYPGFQNFFITSQFLSMTLTPCNDSFALQSDKKVELQNHFVTNLHMHFTMHGLEGEVELTVPVRFFVTTLFQFLQERNPVQLEVSYNQVKLGEESKTVELKQIKAYVVSEGLESICQEYEDFDMQVDPTNTKEATMVAYHYKIKLRFVDAFRYFTSMHKPFMLYQDKSYESVLKAQLGEMKATEFVKLTVDSGFQEFTSNRVFICMPFTDHRSPLSLYDFWMATIRTYNGHLVMKDDGSYTVAQKREPIASQNDDIDKFDKPFIKRVAMRQHDAYNTQLEFLNGIHKDGKGQKVKSNNSKQSQGVFSKSNMVVQNFPSIFDAQCKFEGARYMNHFSLEYLMEIEFNGLPYEIPLWPGNQVKLKASNWQNLFGSQDLELTVVEMVIDFHLMPNEPPPIDYRDKKDLTDDKLKNVMARFQSKTDQALRPFTAASCCLICENKESTYQHLPPPLPMPYPLVVQGEINVTQDVTSKYDNQVPYQVFDGATNDPGNANTNKEDSGATVYTLAGMPQHYLSYHVKLPVFGSEAILPVMYLPNIISDQFFSPFQNLQAVRIFVYQEHAELDGLAEYTSDENVDKEKQVSSFVFGPEKQGEFRFEVSSSGETLSLTKEELKAKTKKSIIMQDDTMLISFESEE